MSKQYDLYLEQHKGNVRKGFYWIKEHLPELILTEGPYKLDDYEQQICFAHDASKTDPEEYDAYDAYFYGNNRSFAVCADFDRAWLRHIHRNPHHWQYWILINDDPKNGEKVLDMDYIYTLEMICDWMAFGIGKGNMRELFVWYNEHKRYMKLSDNTRTLVEHILDLILEKLDELEESAREV